MIKIDKKTVLYIIGAVLFGLLTYFCISSILYNNGSGIDAVRNELSDVKTKQQSAIDRLGVVESGLADSQKRVDEITKSVNTASSAIDDVTDRIDNSQKRIESSSDAIESSEQIIERVRERGKTGN